jgi:protein O-GlcNAc transferase
MTFTRVGSAAVPAASPADAIFRDAVQLHQQGRPFQADALCVQVLRVNSRHAGAWHLRGVLALEGGAIQQGIDFIERSLKLQPAQPAAHSNIGNALLEQGQPERALARFERALRIKPDYPPALFNRGNALRALARAEEALASYGAVLALQPQHVTCLNNRALALLDLGRFAEATASLEQAVALQPTYTEALRNLAAALLKANRPEESLAACDRAVASEPQVAAAWFNRGNALVALDEPARALDSFARALQIRPEFVDCLINRGSAYLTLHRPHDALADFEQALVLNSKSALALNNAGNALLALGHPEAALARYDAALQLDPLGVDTLYNRGAALRDLRRFEAAAAAYGAVLALAPEHGEAAGNLFHVQMDACSWADYGELAARLRDDLERRRWVINPLSGLLLDVPQLQLACARGHVTRHYPQARHGLCPPVDPAAGRSRSLRVAYISADFREHPVSHLVTGVLERHDRSTIEVTGVALTAAEDSTPGRRMRAACDHFVDASGLADDQVAALLRERGIDIAVDLMGFTQGMRLGILAHRAAPVQVNYLGYAGTSGADFIDYLIADHEVIPAGAERWYAEQIVRLPHCYLPYDERCEMAQPPTRAAAGLPEQAFVFCAFTNSYKISPPVFDAWMWLLSRLPESILWLRAPPPQVRANLQREAASRGVEAHRLVFAPHVRSMAEHLGRQSLADLYLDTAPYNAHSTACDALWCAVPLVTCTGLGFASRVAASALRAAGLPDLVASDLAEYRQVALDLASNPQRLQQLRATLRRERAALPLFNSAAYVSHLEAAYHGMQQRALCGGRPAAFSVPAMPPPG